MNRRRLVVIGVTVAVVGAGAGSALAYWTSTGSGSGTASVGTTSPFTVTVGTPTGGALSPAGPFDSVSFTVTNTNSGYQTVGVATASIANPDGSAWTSVAGCSAADFQISGASVAAADLAPGASTNGSLDLRMIDRTSDQSGCKGASVPIYVSVAPGPALTPQTITVTAAPTTGQVGGTGTVSATGGGSPRPVLIVTNSPSICSFTSTSVGFMSSSGTVSYLTTGTCTLLVNQPGTGGGGYAAAPTRTVSIAVS